LALFTFASEYILAPSSFPILKITNLALGLPVDGRDYGYVVNVLNYFKIKSVKLMSNNPEKFEYLRDKGINVIERIPVLSEPTFHDAFYLETKKIKLGHQI